MIGLRRLRARDDDSGFALIFVMFISMIIIAAVATTLSVTTPNIINSKNDQDAAGAMIAAQSGIDDALAYLLSVPSCRSTTKVCPQALGTSSTALGRSNLAGTNQSFSWTTDSHLTADEYVRVYSTGTAGSVTKKLTADLSLAPSILSFGYYTNYESQAPDILYDYFDPRTIDITDQDTYEDINAYDNHRNQIRISDPTTVHWNGPATSGTNPYPAYICAEHWYKDSDDPGPDGTPGASLGRYIYGSNSVWGETGTIDGSSVTRTSSCDVVFTSGMTMYGPLYSRDALLISDGTNNGVGPRFMQPAYTLWGFNGYDTPKPGASPWREDSGVGGDIHLCAVPTTDSPSCSPYAPAVAGLDLVLPNSIATESLPDSYCVYTGPTRVKLNGDGTATVTSPETTTRNTLSDAACYPTGSLAAGIVNFTLNYQSAHTGTIYVEHAGSIPSAGWPENPTKSTNTPSTSNEVFYLPATGGATTPDQPDSSAAPSTCTSSARYAKTASWPCAWTGVYSSTDTGTGSGWSTYTAASCGSASASNRQLFECEYGHQSSSSSPSVNQSAGYYKTLRTDVQSDLAAGSCVAGNTTAQTTCLTSLLNGDLQPANTGQHAYNYANPSGGDHRYVVTATSAGSGVAGTAQAVGALPTGPMSGDSMFSYTGTKAQEAAIKTPITFNIGRQVWSSSNGGSWGSTTAQFTLTVTQSDWSITAAATGANYFPDTDDVTSYNTGASSTGAAAGSGGANQPGDLYVEGTNSGQLSLVAENDVIMTSDITDTSSDPTVDALDIVAGHNARNYHPVSCVDETAGDINATTSGWCPNDITGLYRSVLEKNGTLYPEHPAMQYQNMMASQAASPPTPRRIDAAIFALSGSFVTDNYNRGLALGQLTVNGGIYQSHRGANGTQWEYTGSGARPSSGYSLQYRFVDLEHAELPYAPPATGGSNSRVWNVVSMSAGGS